MQAERQARMGRRQPMSLQILSAAELLELENATRERHFIDHIRVFIPLLLWVLWMMVGTCFYAVHSDYGWAKGLYMSVNIGWGLNWPLDESFYQDGSYNTPSFRLYSLFHTAAGTVFLGASTIYIAQVMTGSKDNWINRTRADTGDSWLSHLSARLPHYRAIMLLIVWFFLGVVWFWALQDWDILSSIDFVISTLTGGGYRSIVFSSPNWQYAMAALYTTAGVPLMAITIGLSVSVFFEPTNDDLISKLIADITQEELSFMEEYGVIDGDGEVDRSEFIILMTVRIGKASPDLIGTINDRFRELDRRHMKRIPYDDIIAGRRQVTPAMRKLAFARGLSSINLNSFADVVSGSLSPRQLVSSGSFLSSRCSVDSIVEETSAAETNMDGVPSAPNEGCVCANSGDVELEVVQQDISVSSPNTSNHTAGIKLEIEIPEVEDDSHSSRSTGSSQDEHSTVECGSRSDDKVQEMKTAFRSRRGQAKSLHSIIGNLRDTPIASSRRGSVYAPSPLYAPSPMLLRTLSSTLKIEDQDTLSPSGSDMAVVGDRLLCMSHAFRSFHPYVKIFISWVLWVLIGTLFYSLYDATGSGSRISPARGFYISTSVGVGMFWMRGENSLEYDAVVKVFTLAHMLLGAVAVGVVRAAVANELAESKSNWYKDVLRKKKLAACAKSSSVWDYAVELCKYYGPKEKAHIAFLSFCAVGVGWCCGRFDFYFLRALFFSFSSMTGGGLQPVPLDAKDWEYAVVGLYVACGTPIAAVSLSLLAQTIASTGAKMNLTDIMNTLITEKELEMMRSFEIENGDGYITMSEFAVLMLVRMDAISTDMIKVINEWYHGLDPGDAGGISYDKLTRSHVVTGRSWRKKVAAVIGRG